MTHDSAKEGFVKLRRRSFRCEHTALSQIREYIANRSEAKDALCQLEKIQLSQKKRESIRASAGSPTRRRRILGTGISWPPEKGGGAPLLFPGVCCCWNVGRVVLFPRRGAFPSPAMTGGSFKNVVARPRGTLGYRTHASFSSSFFLNDIQPVRRLAKILKNSSSSPFG